MKNIEGPLEVNDWYECGESTQVLGFKDARDTLFTLVCTVDRSEEDYGTIYYDDEYVLSKSEKNKIALLLEETLKHQTIDKECKPMIIALLEIISETSTL